jgi:hypothetical protein
MNQRFMLDYSELHKRLGLAQLARAPGERRFIFSTNQKFSCWLLNRLND